jgi:protein-S-isoprenylcysteine O-methyltransferase Ste14
VIARDAVALGWLLQAITWVAALARTGRTAARRSEWPVELALRGAVTALVLASLVAPAGHLVSLGPGTTAAAVIVVIGGHALAALARVQLGGAWGIGVTPHSDTPVVRGVYRLVRHPIYWGTGAAIFGQAVTLQSLPALLLLAGAALVNPWKILLENRSLRGAR